MLCYVFRCVLRCLAMTTGIYVQRCLVMTTDACLYTRNRRVRGSRCADTYQVRKRYVPGTHNHMYQVRIGYEPGTGNYHTCSVLFPYLLRPHHTTYALLSYHLHTCQAHVRKRHRKGTQYVSGTRTVCTELYQVCIKYRISTPIIVLGMNQAPTRYSSIFNKSRARLIVRKRYV